MSNRKKPTERERFEKWFLRAFPQWGEMTRALDGGYESSWIDGAWTGWQARAKRTGRSAGAAHD